jgi:hypothetical protein
MNLFTARSVLLVAALSLSLACAGQTPPPRGPVATSAPDAARPTDPPVFAPLAAGAGPAPAAMGPSKVRLQIREAIFTAAWTAVRDKDFDKTLAGLGWQALRAKYQPLALAAPDEPTFYRLLNEMLGALGQSHLEVHGPGDEAEAQVRRDRTRATAWLGRGHRGWHWHRRSRVGGPSHRRQAHGDVGAPRILGGAGRTAAGLCGHAHRGHGRRFVVRVVAAPASGGRALSPAQARRPPSVRSHGQQGQRAFSRWHDKATTPC